MKNSVKPFKNKMLNHLYKACYAYFHIHILGLFRARSITVCFALFAGLTLGVFFSLVPTKAIIAKKISARKGQSKTEQQPIQQTDTYELRTIAFYNLENLFDTINHPTNYDQDRTPNGKDQWTAKRFNHKIGQLARVIKNLGRPEGLPKNRFKALGADILGVCEIENSAVLEALVAHPDVAPLNYGIIHQDSPDERGIDVALLFKKDRFIPATFNSHPLYLYTELQRRNYTRDQLVVMGYLDTQPIWFIVNHWPSRSGGEARSKPYRLAAAMLNLKIIDSIRQQDPNAQIISMGDFNDNPVNDTFKIHLQTAAKPKDTSYHKLYNPMESLYKKGIGSLAYRDQWSLFDQFYITQNLLQKSLNRFYYWKVGVFSPRMLITPRGRYKGYPFRSYSAGQYSGGFSDHFPVQLFLIRKRLRKPLPPRNSA